MDGGGLPIENRGGSLAAVGALLEDPPGVDYYLLRSVSVKWLCCSETCLISPFEPCYRDSVPERFLCSSLTTMNITQLAEIFHFLNCASVQCYRLISPYWCHQDAIIDTANTR